MQKIIDKYNPDEIAIEAPFFGKNVQSMLKLGRAQGVAMAAGLMKEIPITEYSPKKIKMAITGIVHKKNKIFLLFFINISFTTSCYFHSSNFLHNLSKFLFVLNFNLYFKACKFFIYGFSIYISYINARSCKN